MNETEQQNFITPPTNRLQKVRKINFCKCFTDSKERPKCTSSVQSSPNVYKKGKGNGEKGNSSEMKV